MIPKKQKKIMSLNTKLKRHKSIIAYDSDWQFPAITEQHAYNQGLKLLPYVQNVRYFAFPWATLIDLINRERPTDDLMAILRDVTDELKGYQHVITVCQHIQMLQYQCIFAESGITHVFWSHAIRGQNYFPDYSYIKIFPFPLYPVQAAAHYQNNIKHKKYLYSFVGAKANQWYLTNTRNQIIDTLSHDNRGLVIGREQWHFNKIVYDHQILSEANKKNELVDLAAAEEYRKILKDSIFSICPSGSGPNSIR
jgi:hypothetical protein